MSRIYDLRADFKASIVAADLGLAPGDIIIARQADIFAEIETVVSQAENGIVLVIAAARKRNLAEKLPLPRWEVTLDFELWVTTIYTPGTMPEEDIAEGLENHLSQLKLVPGSPHSCAEAVRVISSEDVPDPDYLVRRITCQMILQNKAT